MLDKKRYLSWINAKTLSIIFVMSLTACGSKEYEQIENISPVVTEQSEERILEETDKETQGEVQEESTTLSEDQSSPQETSTAVYSDLSQESLDFLYACMEKEEHTAAAVGYIGYWMQSEEPELTYWRENHACVLLEEMPFLEEVPVERIFGKGYGHLYCIVPQKDIISMVVNPVNWQQSGDELLAEADEVLYQTEEAEPIIVFVNMEENQNKPDIRIEIVEENGNEVIWYPEFHEDYLVHIPEGENQEEKFLDFSDGRDSLNMENFE